MGLSDESILKLAKKTPKWWETLLRSGTDEDRKTVDGMTGHAAKVDKVLGQLEPVIKQYLTFDEKERVTNDPDVLKIVEKIDKYSEQYKALLTQLHTKAEWPTGTKLRDKLKAELDTFKTFKILNRKEQLEEVDLEGKVHKNRKDTGGERIDLVKARVDWEKAQREALNHRTAYKTAKLKANEAFGKYEKLVAERSPSYRLRKLDWGDEGFWDKLAADPEMLQEYVKKTSPDVY